MGEKMKKGFKFILTTILLFFILCFYASKIGLKATVSNTYFEDFIAMSHEKMLFVEENNISKCYLIEGVTPSYMIYDYDHNELLYYCENSYSPWYQYNGHLFSEYGYVYLHNAGYCMINLSEVGSYSYGDIVNIDGSIENYIKNDEILANKCKEIIDIPDKFDFSSLFPVDNVIEDVEIENAYYFKNLNKNIGDNQLKECTLISLAGLVSYFDIFYDDTIIPDQYMDKEIVYNHHTENAISSPGGLKFYDYLVTEKVKETTEYQYNSPYFDRLGDKPWYFDEHVKISLVSRQLLDIIYDTWCTSPTHNVNCTECFSKKFDLVRFSNSHPDGANYEYDFEDLIQMGLPVVIGMYSESYDTDEDDVIEYPIKYYNADSSEWISISGAGHSFICYGYLKVTERDEHFGTQIVTYYKGHAGDCRDDGSYHYTQAIFSNRFVNGEYGGDNISGYTFVPKTTNYHICSKNYIYTNGNCSFGICPCDSKLTSKEFFQKYSNVQKVGNMDQYICKEHGTHVLYECEHEHEFAYNQETELLHTKYCIVEGCTYSIQTSHNFEIKNIYNSNYHKEECPCGFVKYTNHQFKHISTDNDHRLECEKCRYATTCIGEYTEIYEHTHGYYCEECEKMIYENHELAYESVNENYHRRYCIVCSYSEIVPHQSYGNEFHYITLADGTTIQYCPQCGYEEE